MTTAVMVWAALVVALAACVARGAEHGESIQINVENGACVRVRERAP